MKKHGCTHTRLYQCWADMKQRCHNKNNKFYHRYGGRGITVCEEWMEFEPFAEWALNNGYSDNLTIDRIDNNKGYCPENCKWSTQHEQSMNKAHLPSRTGYVGVRQKTQNSFIAEVTRFGKYTYIGSFPTPELASEARERYLKENSIVLYEDTRQQNGKHKNIHDYCQQNGIRIVRSKLAVGDYMLAGAGGGGISVDTKQDVPEIAGNCFQDHRRFKEECILAQDCGIQLIVLIEEIPPEGDLALWRSPEDRYGKPKHLFDPARLKKVMGTMEERYGVRFRFCDGRSTGKVLMEYLRGEKT